MALFVGLLVLYGRGRHRHIQHSTWLTCYDKQMLHHVSPNLSIREASERH